MEWARLHSKAVPCPGMGLLQITRNRVLAGCINPAFGPPFTPAFKPTRTG